MDFGSVIAYNSFSFAPAGTTTAGVVVERIEPSNVGSSAYFDKKALDDGMDAGDIYLAQRSFVIHASIYGSSEAALWDTYDDVVTAFAPSLAYNADSANLGFLPLKFTRATDDTTNFPNGIPMQIYLRATAPPLYQEVRRKQQGYGTGAQMPIAIPMVARDPRFYSQNLTTVSISPATSTQTTTHHGTYPVWGTWSFTVSGSGSSVAQVYLSSVLGAGYVGFNLSTHTGTEILSLDMANRLLKNPFGTSIAQFFGDFVNSVYQEVVPGANKVYVKNTSNLSAISFQYREAWL